MYPAHDEELEDEQCLPLTGVNCAEIDEALRSLSEATKDNCGRTFEETRKLLKQVCRVSSWPWQIINILLTQVVVDGERHNWAIMVYQLLITAVPYVQSSLLRDTVVSGYCDTESLKRALQGFVEHGGIKVYVRSYFTPRPSMSSSSGKRYDKNGTSHGVDHVHAGGGGSAREMPEKRVSADVVCRGHL